MTVVRPIAACHDSAAGVTCRRPASGRRSAGGTGATGVVRSLVPPGTFPGTAIGSAIRATGARRRHVPPLRPTPGRVTAAVVGAGAAVVLAGRLAAGRGRPVVPGGRALRVLGAGEPAAVDRARGRLAPGGFAGAVVAARGRVTGRIRLGCALFRRPLGCRARVGSTLRGDSPTPVFRAHARTSLPLVRAAAADAARRFPLPAPSRRSAGPVTPLFAVLIRPPRRARGGRRGPSPGPPSCVCPGAGPGPGAGRWWRCR